MALWDRVTRFLALEPWAIEEAEIQARDTVPDDSLAGLIARLQATRASAWRPAGIREALGVPAIFRAVSFIANTVGALSLDTFRNGVKMDPALRPRIVVRPDPFRTPRAFYRDTAWNMATRGEAWWWVAARDVDDSALSVINVPPHEITVSIDERDLRYPRIDWRGNRMPNDDMIHLSLVQEPGELRGTGPLQLCGAAASVAVEAQEFAANFYGSGGKASDLIKMAYELGTTVDDNGLTEADRLKAAWTNTPNNVPRIVDTRVESVEYKEPNEAGAQMLASRDYQNGDAARMFGIPGSLLEYSHAGASLTYQNVAQELDKFVRTCLWPNYLEPIEQAMTDLLTRSTVAYFNTDALLRVDPLTRYQIYNLGIPLGVLSVEAAQAAEGIVPGDIERAPIPFAPPQAIPASLPVDTWAAAARTEPLRIEAPRAGPQPVVTRQQVLTARAVLQARGEPSGYGSIAKHLNVSESTVRRRLLQAA